MCVCIYVYIYIYIYILGREADAEDPLDRAGLAADAGAVLRGGEETVD